MKYTKESLQLTFDLRLGYRGNNVYFWRTNNPLKQMFCYTFDLDYDSNLNDTDREKIQNFFGNYFTESDVANLYLDDASLRVELFLAMTNSPKCPYKIVGVSSYAQNYEVITVYHFMVKHNILTKSNTITI